MISEKYGKEPPSPKNKILFSTESNDRLNENAFRKSSYHERYEKISLKPRKHEGSV
jgi:hypothetical protein